MHFLFAYIIYIIDEIILSIFLAANCRATFFRNITFGKMMVKHEFVLPYMRSKEKRASVKYHGHHVL